MGVEDIGDILSPIKQSDSTPGFATSRLKSWVLKVPLLSKMMGHEIWDQLIKGATSVRLNDSYISAMLDNFDKESRTFKAFQYSVKK